MIDRTLQRLSREEQAREGRDTPPQDLSPREFRALVSYLVEMGFDIAPYTDAASDYTCVSVTCAEEFADDALGVYAGTQETLPNGIVRITWPEAAYPVTGQQLVALWEDC